MFILSMANGEVVFPPVSAIAWWWQAYPIWNLSSTSCIESPPPWKKMPYLPCKLLFWIFSSLFIEACLSPRIKFIELQTKRESMTKELQTDKRSLPIRTLSGNDPVSVPSVRRVCSVYMKQFWNYHNVSMKLAPSFSSLHAKELVGKKWKQNSSIVRKI